MLVLADTDTLCIDLDQFSQWVLQASCNADGTAQGHVQVRQFLAGVLARRIHGRTGLADHYFFNERTRRTILRRRLHALDKVGSQPIGIAAAGAVSDGNQVHAVGGAMPGQRVQRAFPITPRLQRIHGVGGQHLAGRVDHRHLAAGANTGVQTHHDTRAGRRRQQQVAQVFGEYLDRHLLGLLAQAAEQIALQAKAELDLPGPRNALADQVIRRSPGVAPTQVDGNIAFGQGDHRASGRNLCRAGCNGGNRYTVCKSRFIEHEFGVEQLLRAPAKHGERPVRRHGADRLGVVKIIAELGVVRQVCILAIQQFALQQAFAPQPFTQLAHQRSVLGPAL